MKLFSTFSIVCSVFLLGACDHYSERLASIHVDNADIHSIEPASGGEMTFGGYLASEYYQLAQYEQNHMHDYRAAKYYFTKAEKLSQGEMVMPAKLKNFNIDSSKKAELSMARADLINALQEYSIPDNRSTLARAVSRFDCWVDEAEENKTTTNCKSDFQAALDDLVESDNLDFFLNDLLMDDVV